MTGKSAYLKALTPEAKACLGAFLYEIPFFPFRVGRESRSRNKNSHPESRRRHDSRPNNDLYLRDTGTLLNISREHFQIEQRNGVFFIVDRNSMCGTLVEGERVGKDRAGGERRLENGDVIIVGTSESRQIFKFLVGSDDGRNA